MWKKVQRPANNTWLLAKIANVSSGLSNRIAQSKNRSGQNSAGFYPILIIEWMRGSSMHISYLTVFEKHSANRLKPSDKLDTTTNPFAFLTGPISGSRTASQPLEDNS